jgi:hypothetical protein
MSSDLFKDYVPEIVEYDEAIDGYKTTFRLNIRTENKNN